MSDRSTNLSLPYLAAAQAQKHVTLNEALLMLDALVQPCALSRTVAAQPASPDDGALHILPAGKSGDDWGGMADGALAYYRDGVWEEIAPREGWTFYVRDEDRHIVFNGALWGPAHIGDSAGVFRNRLHNPAFQINQRGLASHADDSYCFDRWYVLTQTGAIVVSALTDPEPGRPSGIRLTQSQASAQRIGLAQIVESADIRDLRSQAAALAARVRCSQSQAIRMAILEWTGTADAVVSDVVNSWTNGAFSAGQFFTSATLNVIATGAAIPAAATWTDLTEISGQFGGSLTNAVVMVWTEGILAQNETLDLDQVQLEPGAACGPFARRTYAEELAICERFFERAGGEADGIFSGGATRTTGTAIDMPVNFRTAKRIVPSLVHSTPAWATSAPTTGNEITVSNTAAGAFFTVSGALALSALFPTQRGALLRMTLGTSVSGSNGNAGFAFLGSGALVGFSADL